MPRNPACTALIFSPRPALRGIPWPAGPRLGAPRGLRQRRGSPRRCDSAPAAGGAAASGAAPRSGQVRVQSGGSARLIRPFITVHGGRHAVFSSNWSGYAAHGGTYKNVSANWVEPKGHCSGSRHKYSSFWVGLDGYNSNSVEQTGSEVDCKGGTAKYYSWYEMFPKFPVKFSNTVRPGDHFHGSVTYNGGGRFTLKLSDTTRGWAHT